MDSTTAISAAVGCPSMGQQMITCASSGNRNRLCKASRRHVQGDSRPRVRNRHLSASRFGGSGPAARGAVTVHEHKPPGRVGAVGSHGETRSKLADRTNRSALYRLFARIDTYLMR